MNNDSILMKRRSARDFTDQPIDVALLKTILAEAQQAPSWENTQPWKVYVAMGDTANKIRAAHQESTNSEQKSWTEVIPPHEWSPRTQQNLDKWLNDASTFLGDAATKDFAQSQPVFFNAPAIAYITVPKDSSNYSTYDAGAFGYGILLSAFEHGVGTIPAYEFIRFPEEIRAQFDIPEDESIMMGIGLGYPETKKLNTLKTTREPLDDIFQLKD